MTSPQIAAFAQLGQLWKQVQAEFAESLPVSDPDVLQMVQELLEEETGDVDRIVDLTIDDTDTFRGRAEQRISLGRSQTLQFTISPERMSYKLVGNASFGETDEEWAEIIEFAAKTKKKLNCKPGNVQCGGKCQSGSKNCFADMSPDQKKKAQAAARKAKRLAKKAEQSKQEEKPKPKSTMPDGVTVDRATMRDQDEPYNASFYNFRINDSTVDLVVTEGDFYAKTAGANATVDFSVDYSMDKTGSLSGRDAVVAAIKLRRIMEHDAASRPDGYVYGVVAYSLDGFGARRQQAYEKMGFSAPIRDSRGYQKAVVENGRLKPWTPQ